MIATRTFPSSRRARPLVDPLVDIRSSMNQLLADVQDALHHGDPRGCSQEVDRPLKPAPGREHEAGGEYDDALRAGADPDVAAQTERLRLCAHIRDEERAGDRDDCEDDRDV